MIKKLKSLFTILLILFFGFWISSFVNAVVYVTDFWMTLSPSSYSNPLFLENNFKLNSILWNTDKDFFYVVHNYNSSSQWYYTFGWKWNRLYWYSKSVGCSSNTVYQWYVNKIYKCPCWNPYWHSCSSSETYINTFSDCVYYSDFSLPVFELLIQDVSRYWYWMITYNDALNVGSCGPVGFMRTPFSSFDNTTSEYWYMIAPDVSDSNNYSLSSSFTIQDVESVINFNISPLNWSSGGGWTWTGDVSVWTWLIVTPSCNKLKALNWYQNKGYSERLCYGGLDNYNIWDWNPVWTLPVYWTWKDVLDIWAETANLHQFWSTWSTMWYEEWFEYWRMLYNLYKRGSYSNNPFVNTPLVLFTYFGAVDIYWDWFSNGDIIEYCDLKLYTADYSVPYTWINNNKVCSLVDIVRDWVIWGGGSVWSGWIDWDNGIIWVNPIWIIGSWSIWTWSWTWSVGSGDSEMTGYVDWRNFIIDFFGALQDNFWDIANNNFWQWILPIYITIALMWLILFRFLSH